MIRKIVTGICLLLALPAAAADLQCGDGSRQNAEICKGNSLGLPVAEQPKAAHYQTGVTAKVLAKTTVTGDGQKIAYPVTDRAEVTAMLVDIAPGAATGWHKHQVPVYAYVLAGDLEVELEGGSKKRFKEGDVIIEVVNAPHNGRNTGTEPVKLVVFYLGIQDQPNVTKLP